jgi:hypothetical protein
MSPLVPLGRPLFKQELSHVTRVLYRLVSQLSRSTLDLAVFAMLVTVVVVIGIVQNGLLTITTPATMVEQSALVLLQSPVS